MSFNLDLMALKQIEIFIGDFFYGCFFVYEKIHGKFPIEINIFFVLFIALWCYDEQL
jgi:hypothetical protein